MFVKILLMSVLATTSCFAMVEQNAYSQKDLLQIRQQSREIANKYHNRVKGDIKIANQQTDIYKSVGHMMANLGMSKLPKTSESHHPKYYQGVMIFASLGMPKQSLIALVRQAHRLGLPVILRGFYKGDARLTAKVIRSIVYPTGSKEPIGGFVTDPNWYSMYGIKKVPAFVVTDQLMPCNSKTVQQGCVATDYDIVYGNVSISTALKAVVSKGKFKEKAQRYLDRTNKIQN